MTRASSTLAVPAAAAGGMLIVFGGYDDSPGGQLLGLALVAALALGTTRGSAPSARGTDRRT